MNSLYQQLNRNQNQNNSNLQQLINNFKNSNNPQEFLMNYIKANPQMQNIYLLLQNSNKSPKELFYTMAQQRGIDPNTILDMLK